MKPQVLALFIGLFCSSILTAQDRWQLPVLYAKLQNEVRETSGLLFFNGQVWTFNDSGNEPVIFALNEKSGKVERKVKLEGATNVDWEAISQDEHFVYVGDFGNNGSPRKQLCIYRIPKKELLEPGRTSVTSTQILFSYKDAGNPGNVNKKGKVKKKGFYDCEAMFCMNDSIYLVSKNWLSQGFAVIYAIPAKPGTYNLEEHTRINASGLICDACLSPDKTRLAVTGYNDFVPFVTIYKIENNSPVRLKEVFNMEYPALTALQTEGICYLSPSTLLISSEANKYHPNSLYILTGVVGQK